MKSAIHSISEAKKNLGNWVFNMKTSFLFVKRCITTMYIIMSAPLLLKENVLNLTIYIYWGVTDAFFRQEVEVLQVLNIGKCPLFRKDILKNLSL